MDSFLSNNLSIEVFNNFPEDLAFYSLSHKNPFYSQKANPLINFPFYLIFCPKNDTINLINEIEGI